MVDGKRTLWRTAAGCALAGLFLVQAANAALEFSFTNSLAQAQAAERRGDLRTALEIYQQAEQTGPNDASRLCVLARRCCNLTYLTNALALQKAAVEQAVACSLQAIRADSNNPEAHACLAVAYAKSCMFADLKAQLTCSRLFKREAERAIALDPSQDMAYYLLGRWNYAMAHAGFFARAYVKLVYGAPPKASYQEAIVCFQKAAALAPNRVIYHTGLAMAYEAAGEGTLALSELRRCQAMKATGPEDEEARRDAAEKLRRLGEK